MKNRIITPTNSILMCSETIKQESIEFNGYKIWRCLIAVLWRRLFLFSGFLIGYDKIKLAGWDSISLDFSFNLFEYNSSLSSWLSCLIILFDFINFLTAGCWICQLRIYLTSPLTSIKLYHKIPTLTRIKSWNLGLEGRKKF